MSQTAVSDGYVVIGLYEEDGWMIEGVAARGFATPEDAEEYARRARASATYGFDVAGYRVVGCEEV